MNQSHRWGIAVSFPWPYTECMQPSHTPLIDFQLFNTSSTDGVSVDKHNFKMKRARCPAVHLGTTRHLKKIEPILFTHLERCDFWDIH